MLQGLKRLRPAEHPELSLLAVCGVCLFVVVFNCGVCLFACVLLACAFLLVGLFVRFSRSASGYCRTQL